MYDVAAALCSIPVCIPICSILQKSLIMNPTLLKFNLGVDTRLYNNLESSCTTEVQLVTAYIYGRRKNRRKGQRKKKGKRKERKAKSGRKTKELM